MAKNTAAWGWTGSGYHELAELEVWFIRNDIDNNRSLFGYSVGNNSNNSFGDTGTISWSLRDQSGTRASGSKGNTPTTAYYQKRTYASGQFWIGHNSDGTLSNRNFVLTMNRNLGNVRTATIRVTVSNIPDIPRASKISSLSNFTIPGGNPSFTIDAHSTAFRHYADLKVNGELIASMGELRGGSHSFNLSTAQQDKIFNMMKNSTSIRFELVVGTRHNNVVIGVYDYKQATVYISGSVVPVINSVTLKDTNTTVSNKFGGYVRGQSALDVSISASGARGSNVKSVRTYFNGRVYNGTSFRTELMTSSGTSELVVEVIDSRNRKTSTRRSISVIDWSDPYLSDMDVVRKEGGTHNDPNSTGLKIDGRVFVRPVNNRNTYDLIIKTRQAGTMDPLVTVYEKKGISHSVDRISVDTTTYSAAEQNKWFYKFDNANSYLIVIEVADALGGAKTTWTIPTGFTLVDFKNNGKGIGIGKHSEKDALEVDMTTLNHREVLFQSKKKVTVTTPGMPVKMNLLAEFTDGLYPLGVLYDPEDRTHYILRQHAGSGTYGTNMGIGIDRQGNISTSVTVLSLDSLNGFRPYNNDYSNMPRVRISGKTVSLAGQVNPPASNSLGGASPVTICRIPSEYAPNQQLTQVCHGSGYDLWLLRVNTNGNVTAERYQRGGSSATPTGSTWMPFSISYVIE
mgnify:CR=1 FL=1